MKSKPHIVVVFHSANLYSGATRSLTDIMNYLIETNMYNIEAIFPESTGSAIEYYREKGIKVYSYRYGKLMQGLNQHLLRRIIKMPLLFARFIRVKAEACKASDYFKNSDVDIVYSNTSSIVFGGYLGLRLGAKQIWHIREFRKADHQIEFFLGDKWLKRFINKCADRVLFVSKSVMESHKDLIDESKMDVTYNSYSQDFITPKNAFNENDILNVLIAGDIKPSKGQKELVEALKLAIDECGKESFKLHVAGKVSDKKYYEDIKERVFRYGLQDRIIFYGQVADMRSLRANMDVGVVASTNEAFGRTTIEGMLSMLAMIGRKSGGTEEQIVDDETGLLYDGSVEDLKRKLCTYYSDRKRLKMHAINGFNESVEKYTKGNCAKIVENNISKLV